MVNGRLPNVTNLNARIQQQNGHLPNKRVDNDTQIHDLEELDTISRHVTQNGGINNHNQMANGVIRVMNGNAIQANGSIPNGKAIGNGFLANGKLASLESQRRDNIRNMYQGYHGDNHI